MRVVTLAAVIGVLAPTEASAFQSMGFKSGMSVEQVRAAVPAGYGLRLNGDFGFVEKGPDTLATVDFCKGRLISLSRSLQAQNEWLLLAGKMTKAYGAPKVGQAADPWAKTAGPDAQGVEMSWRAGADRYALTAWPAGAPIAPGKPRPFASLSVTDFGPVNACAAKGRVAAEASRARVTKAHATGVKRARRKRRIAEFRQRVYSSTYPYAPPPRVTVVYADPPPPAPAAVLPRREPPRAAKEPKSFRRRLGEFFQRLGFRARPDGEDAGPRRLATAERAYEHGEP